MPLIVHRLKIDRDHDGQRLDNFLFSRFKDVPKSHIYRIIRRGEVRLNKRRATASSKLASGDELRVPLHDDRHDASAKSAKFEPSADAVEDLRRRILYEDASLLVVNKRVGEVVHSGSRHRFGLVDALNAMYTDDKIRPLHRLDRGTTGCLLFAKSRAAMLSLHAAFRERDVDKVYWALVAGRWKRSLKMLRSTDERNGKLMETRFRVKREYPRHTLLEARPLSGRTHQIRIQTAAQACPIIGDRKYGDRAHGRVRRLFLHAWRLSFVLDGRRLRFEAPPGDEWRRFVDSLEAAKKGE